MKLRLLGQRNSLGVGTHFGNFVDALKRLYGIDRLLEEVDVFDAAQLQRAADSSHADDVNIWFLRSEQIRTLKGTRVIWCVFESEKLPAEYLDFLQRNADRVWVPTRWGRGVLIDNRIAAECIDVVPGGVDPRLFHAHLRCSLDRSGHPFRFLMVGKFEERKGYRELLTAFAQSFGNVSDVELVIKADYFINVDKGKTALTELVASLGLTNVKLYWGRWPKDQLLGLYNYCDAFVFPSRAEGWGLPLLEAAATGMPVIATFYSGHTEFLQHITSSLTKIDFTLEKIEDPDFKRFWPTADGDLGRWAQPSVASLAAALIAVKEHYPAQRAAARINSLVLREKFTWEVAANVALDLLNRLRLLRADFTVVG